MNIQICFNSFDNVLEKYFRCNCPSFIKMKVSNVRRHTYSSMNGLIVGTLLTHDTQLEQVYQQRMNHRNNLIPDNDILDTKHACTFQHLK
jgi:hypothetical protein